MDWWKQYISYVWLLFTRCFSVDRSDETIAMAIAVDQTMTSSSSSSSTAIAPGRWTYDVFLSFRGEDTRNNFVDHLYAALDQKGVYTFKDDEKLRRGRLISPELLKAIEESRFAVVVFSRNYANSSWCLDELAKIMECCNRTGQRVLPVFYDVDPSDVRGQKGSFGTAFRRQELKFKEDREKLKRWREALAGAANFSGWDVSKTASGREAECIKQIVLEILSHTEPRPADNLIGMGSRVRDVKSLLGKGSGDIFMIGIWGMGGIGKTTIARAVFRQISYKFEGSSFLEDVRENGSDKKGLKSLQKKLLSEVLMDKDVDVRDCDDGVSQIQSKLGRKKVLLVLDDVDNVRQLEFLAGSPEWFGPGSRIMITTRDEHLLLCAQHKYAPKFLDEKEATELFNRYAFKSSCSPQEYKKLSGAVVRYAGHLPLALKVLGSHFCGRKLEFWESALNVLAKIPVKEINQILKLSFDGLNDLEKKIFLDIACFFKGKKRKYVTRILDSFGFEPKIGIEVLIEKSLLTISKERLHMHDLIQEMGWSIVHECHSSKMLWLPEEISEVMTTNDRLEDVEAIVENEYEIKWKAPDRPYKFNAEVLRIMKKLRLLNINWGSKSTGPTYIPDQLRWLRWSHFPSRSLVIMTTGISKLVGLEMPDGCMKRISIGNQIILPNLKFIDLSRSSITKFPDVSGFPHLESLKLSACDSLVEVHESVWLHKRIAYLDLNCCEDLQILPSTIQMKSLKTLVLSHCELLERFPEFSGDMGSLLELRLDGCNRIKALPSSTRLLTSLTCLTLAKYLPVSTSVDFVHSIAEELEQELRQGFSMRTPSDNLRIQASTRMSSLRTIDLRHNYLLEEDLPRNFQNVWPSLEELDLSENIFTRLPATIHHLSHLKLLDLIYCIDLEELPELPSSIQVLRADNCKSLQKIGDLSNKYKWLFKISLHRSPKLLKNQESQNYLANLLKRSFMQKCAAANHRSSIVVPGSKIPDWFSNQQSGHKIALKLPPFWVTKSRGFAICCVLTRAWVELNTNLKIKFELADSQPDIDVNLRSSAKHGDRVWIGYIPFELFQQLYHDFRHENWSQIEGWIVISLSSGIHDILECGACIVYKEDVEQITGTGPCFSDYDKLECFKGDNQSDEGSQRRRWSSPIFTIDDENTEDHKIIKVLI